MNNTELKSALRAALEKEIQPESLQLWPAVSQRLAAGKRHPFTQGDASMKTTTSRKPLLRWAALSLAALVLALAVLLATPQGRAWAQKMFQFFNITSDKSYPLPPGQVFPIRGTPSPVPTYSLPLQTVEPGLPPTQPPAPDQSCASSQSTYFCQVKAVETLAGFDALEFPNNPKGLKFSKISFDSAQQTIETEYPVISGGGYLHLRQGQGDFLSGNDWDKVPADAIRKVSVNGNYAELASGGFYVLAGASEAVWQPGGALRLRWRDAGRWFSLEKMGDPAPIEWLDEDEIVSLAASLVSQRPFDAAPPLDPEYLPDVATAEKLAGFDLLEPSLLPQGYQFKRAVWADGVARLIYGPTDSSDSSLFIFMGQLSSTQKAGPCSQCPPGAEEIVSVGTWQGWYSRGGFSPDSSTTGGPTPTPAWDPQARQWQLTWNTGDLWVNLFYLPSSDYGGEMNKATLLAIAESLK